MASLRFKIGTHPARVLHVRRKRKPPVVGETVLVVDKSIHGSKPERILITKIDGHFPEDPLYFAERV